VHLDPEPPDLSASPLGEAVVAGAVAAQAAEAHGHTQPVHTHCENCGTPLQGPFCHKCGQHDIDFHRSFGHMFLDALENFFHFDAKLFRNIVTLLFRPGRLTAAFNAGKRAAQMPPLRLYIFVSVLFFFISFIGGAEGGKEALVNTDLKGQLVAARPALLATTRALAAAESDPAKQQLLNELVGQFERPLTEKLVIPEERLHRLPARLAQQIREAMGKEAALREFTSDSQPEPARKKTKADPKQEREEEWGRYFTEKGKYAFEHQHELKEAFVHALPKMLLVCLPFFALFTRVLFRQSGLAYLQHLIVALHFHTFIFLWRLFADGWVFLAHFVSSKLAALLGFGASVWLVLYVFLMLRHLFGNSWPRTIVKTFVLAGAYGLTLGLGFLATGIIIFLLV
jgi:hypothetical protein